VGFLSAGGERGVERWFWELGEGVVDLQGVVRALRAQSYDGWFIVESDESPDPAASAMLNGWMVQHRLRPTELFVPTKAEVGSKT